MKIRIEITLDFDEAARRGVRWDVDEDGIASRQECKEWIMGILCNAHCRLGDLATAATEARDDD